MGNLSEQLFFRYQEEFQNSILRLVEPFEKKRIKAIFKMFFFSLFFVSVGVILVVFFFYLFLHSIFNTFLWTIILFVIYAFLFRGIFYHVEVVRDFEVEFSKYILKYFLKPVANFKPWPLNYNKESIIDSGIFPNFVVQEDLESYFGFYNKTNVMITDTSLGTVTPMDKHDLFKGIILQFEFEKKLAEHLIIKPSNALKPIGYVKLDTRYDNYFSVFSKDKNEDINFIDDEFFELVKNLVLVFGALSFSMSISNNIVVVGLPTKTKAFQFRCMFKSLKDIKTYDELIKKFIAVFNLVDKLKI